MSRQQIAAIRWSLSVLAFASLIAIGHSQPSATRLDAGAAPLSAGATAGWGVAATEARARNSSASFNSGTSVTLSVKRRPQSDLVGRMLERRRQDDQLHLDIERRVHRERERAVTGGHSGAAAPGPRAFVRDAKLI